MEGYNEGCIEAVLEEAREGVMTRVYRKRDILDDREVVFLANYYGSDSPTKGNGAQSAIDAGYSELTAHNLYNKLLKKYEDCSFRASGKAVGITKPYLAMRLKQIMEDPKSQGNVVLAAIRLSLANMGETTDSSGSGSVNFNAPTMVIMGATPKRLKALTSGGQMEEVQDVQEGTVGDREQEEYGDSSPRVPADDGADTPVEGTP